MRMPCCAIPEECSGCGFCDERADDPEDSPEPKEDD